MNKLFKAATGAALSIGLVAGAAVAQEADAFEAAPSADVTIELNATAEGAPEGHAMFAAAEAQTEVMVHLTGVATDVPLAAVLVSGTCTEDGEVIAELGAIEVDAAGNGSLHAALPIDLETVTSAPISVEVRPETEMSRDAVACGAHEPVEVDTLPEPQPEPLPEPQPEPLPEPMPEPQPQPEPVPPVKR
jgi:hypothetical protein